MKIRVFKDLLNEICGRVDETSTSLVVVCDQYDRQVGTVGSSS